MSALRHRLEYVNQVELEGAKIQYGSVEITSNFNIEGIIDSNDSFGFSGITLVVSQAASEAALSELFRTKTPQLEENVLTRSGVA